MGNGGAFCWEVKLPGEGGQDDNSLEYSKVKGKGKGLLITGHEGQEGEQMYSSSLPLTSVLDGGGWSTSRLGRFASGKEPVPVI
jgi:hypothetical protein